MVTPSASNTILICFSPWKANGNADGLSRRPYETCELSALQLDDPQTATIRELRRRDIELSGDY